MSEQDMKNHIANQNYLSKLNAEKTAIDESFKPVEWFKIKHECETPGLMTGLTPTQTSTTSWDMGWSGLCILDARKKCTDIYNMKKKMPYFSVFKNNFGKLQWAIFEITDEQFNTKSDKRSVFSSIELEQNNLEMNIDFKGGEIAFKDKNSIIIPPNYTINSGKGSCSITVKEQISDCDRILREKKDMCGVAKRTAITANERMVQYQLLENVDKLLDGMSNMEGYETLTKAKQDELVKRKNYSKYGSRRTLNQLRDALRKTKRTLYQINTILNHPSKYNLSKSKWNEMLRKRTTILRKYKRLLDEYKNFIRRMERTQHMITRRYSLNARKASRSKNDATKKSDCSSRKSKMKYYTKKNWWGRTVRFARPNRVRCGFVGSGSRELVGYDPNNNFSDFNADDNTNEGFGSIVGNRFRKNSRARAARARTMRARAARARTMRVRAARARTMRARAARARTARARAARVRAARARAARARATRARARAMIPRLDRSRTEKNRRKHTIDSANFQKQANRFGSVAAGNNRSASVFGRRAANFKQQSRRLLFEGFDSKKSTCNNTGVDANFKISHDNSIHNCNSESVFLKYPSADYKKTVDVTNQHTFQITDSLLSNITPALFVSGVGECNNAENVKNQTLELNYSIKHQKENIKIEEILIDRQGNGVLKYSADDVGTHTYILDGKSNNINERRIIIDLNGNVKVNKDVLFTNSVKTDPKYIINGYKNNNNLTSLKSGQEISNLKYRLTLGSAWNNSTLFYTTNNKAGDTGVYDTFNQKFKYTEYYHKTNSSTVQNVFILYKIKTYGVQKLLYENRIYANIEKVLVDECEPNKGSKNVCYIRAIRNALVNDEPLNNNTVNLNTVPLITMKKFKDDVRYKVKYINNALMTSVPQNINEIRIFLIKSLNDIHMKIASVMKSGVSEGFNTGFREYSTIEGYTVDTATGNISPDNTLGDTNLRILDKLRAQNDRINIKKGEMKTEATNIKNKLQTLTGYGGSIHKDSRFISGTKYKDITKQDALLRIHDDYDDSNTLIPFIFDDSKTASDYYKRSGNVGKIDPRAKADAVNEDLKEMLYQQKALYTIGSITSATFIITAILLARNNS